jgi:hypothetical protein
MSGRTRRWIVNRRSILALSMLVVTAAAAALPAAGAGGNASASTQKVFRAGCRSRVNFYAPVTWACTTITVDPWQVQAGATTTATYSFKAKRKLKYVTVCFSKFGNLDDCAYTRNFRTLKRGQVIQRVVQLATPPSTPKVGVWHLDNTTHFCKRWSTASRSDPYWTADSYVQILATS